MSSSEQMTVLPLKQSETFEYGPEILEFMHELEKKSVLKPMFMEAQKELNWKMRKMLILWLIEVHLEYGLCQETLFLTIFILDKITSKVFITRHQYQLVAIAALWTSSKYEENHGRVPTLKNICFISCQTFTEKEIKNMERFILKNISYDLNIPTTESFMKAHCHMAADRKVSLEVQAIATYILEVTLVHRRFIGQLPSFLAKASLVLAHDILGEREWFQSDTSLIECARHMSSILEDPPKLIFKKHATPKYFHASYLTRDWIERKRLMQSTSWKLESMGLITPPKEPEWIPPPHHWQQISMHHTTHQYAYPIYSTMPTSSSNYISRGSSCIW